MLATILKTKVATQVSIAIMDAFVKMRKFISTNLLEQRYINNLVLDHDNRLLLLENSFNEIKTFSKELFFEGQIYDAHSLLLDIFNTSKKSIIIIDNYISKELLDILCRTNKDITIYTKNIDNNLKVLYHCGASFKDLGKKCFGINKINDNNYLNELITHLI